MSYDVAKNKAWEDLRNLNPVKSLAVKFLADEYTVDLENKTVMSLSCNAPAKDFYVILILHYLIKKLQGLPQVTGEWLTFRELSEVEGYFDAFKKRSIDPLIRKFGHSLEHTVITVDAFEGVDSGGTLPVDFLEISHADHVLLIPPDGFDNGLPDNGHGRDNPGEDGRHVPHAGYVVGDQHGPLAPSLEPVVHFREVVLSHVEKLPVLVYDGQADEPSDRVTDRYAAHAAAGRCQQRQRQAHPSL
jgi:hypothetical protein